VVRLASGEPRQLRRGKAGVQAQLQLWLPFCERTLTPLVAR
jgi:hypothetical protein